MYACIDINSIVLSDYATRRCCQVCLLYSTSIAACRGLCHAPVLCCAEADLVLADGHCFTRLLLLQDIEAVGLDLELRQLVKAYNGSLSSPR